jgi:hypothetical protein
MGITEAQHNFQSDKTPSVIYSFVFLVLIVIFQSGNIFSFLFPPVPRVFAGSSTRPCMRFIIRTLNNVIHTLSASL